MGRGAELPGYHPRYHLAPVTGHRRPPKRASAASPPPSCLPATRSGNAGQGCAAPSAALHRLRAKASPRRAALAQKPLKRPISGCPCSRDCSPTAAAMPPGSHFQPQVTALSIRKSCRLLPGLQPGLGKNQTVYFSNVFRSETNWDYNKNRKEHGDSLSQKAFCLKTM